MPIRHGSSPSNCAQEGPASGIMSNYLAKGGNLTFVARTSHFEPGNVSWLKLMEGKN